MEMEIHGDVIVDRSGCGMLDGCWNCIWNDRGVLAEEDAEVGEVMNLVGLADDIWSEDVLSDEEISRRNCGDAVNVCDFGEAVRELCKIIWYFGLTGISVADSDWNEDDWKNGWPERRLDLGKEDGSGDLFKDDCDKYDDDNCDDCGDNTFCNVSVINFENFMFPFLITRRWSL